MAKNFTQEEVSKIYKEQGYELISEYKNCDTILFVKDKDGYICTSRLYKFKKGSKPFRFHKNNPYTIQNIKLWMKLSNINDYELISTTYKNCSELLFFKDKEGCICSTRWESLQNHILPSRFHQSNPYTIHNIEHFIELHAEGYKLISTEYVNAKSELSFKCPEEHIFPMNWNSFQQGQRCPICSGNKITKENCIATTDPWMIDLGMSREDAETHTRGSGDKVTVTCPHCGKTKRIIIKQIYVTKSISCSCGDGISYPEKFVIELLNQINIKYTKEYTPKWSNGKRYDFYLKDYNIILETHGEQHYKQTARKGGRTLQEEQENDEYKKELALSNGIDNYIILDCRISSLEQIKNSILSSELNNLFNLSKIDWSKCEEFALKNRIKEVCDYWYLHNEVNGENLTTSDIANVFNLNKNTICRYLKKGQKIGLCITYNPKEEQSKGAIKSGKSTGKPVEIFKDGKSLGVFESCHELERQSEKLFGVKLGHSVISKVCHGKQKTHKGYTFKYISKEEYEERIKQIKNNS